MKRVFTRLTAVAASAVLSVSALPLTFNAAAADNYLVRDPFYNYEKGYNYYESEHFQFIWGNSGDASRVTQEFLQENASNLEECWDVYMNDLEMLPPSESTNLYLRDGNEYKTNLYISGTGLEGMTDDWAYMSYDSGGFAYLFCCVDSMQYNPPSWVLPHEFGHAVTAHQLGWNTNKYSYAWWEAMGNWFREQYLYSDYSTDETGHGTDFFETYLKNSSLTFPCGRDFYAAWPFLQYLTENPENLEGYGKDFMKTMLQQGEVDEYPFDMVERLAPADLKDTLGHYAKHMACLDFENGDAYRARLDELLNQGSWNWQQIYTMLEPSASSQNHYSVPTERAPQHAGLNIIPLVATENEITITFDGGEDSGDNWRACIVQQLGDGSCVYSELFKNKQTMTVTADTNAVAAYLTVIATPDLDKVTKLGLPGGPGSEFAEENIPFTSKERYPYAIEMYGAEIKKREVATGNNWWESYHNHPNGGGLVSDNANVADSVYVGPDAKVLGSATVSGNVRVEDYAVVQDSAVVSDNAVISGYAVIAERANVSGNAHIDDTALVMGNARVSGNSKVIESACVYGDYTMTDDAVAKGTAFCMANGSISGQGVVDGDYYDDGGKTVNKGTAYGWVSSQSYVDALEYTDKLMYAYDFSNYSGSYFNDRYNSTYATAVENEWNENITGADGVISFRNNSGRIDLDPGVLYTDDIEIQLAALPKRSEADAKLLYFGNSENYISLTLANSEGYPEVVFKRGDLTEKLTGTEKLALGNWYKIRIILDGDTGRLVVNDNIAASGTITINPDDIASMITINDSETAYRIGANEKNEENFNGRIDFVRIFSGEATAPTEVYTESEIEDDILYGDANDNGEVEVADAVFILQGIADPGNPEFTRTERGEIQANCKSSYSSGVDSEDALAIQQFMVGLTDTLPVE